MKIKEIENDWGVMGSEPVQMGGSVIGEGTLGPIDAGSEKSIDVPQPREVLTEEEKKKRIARSEMYLEMQRNRRIRINNKKNKARGMRRKKQKAQKR